MNEDSQQVLLLKTTVVSISFMLLGILLLVIAKLTQHSKSFSWVRDLPILELGSTLFITGALVVVWNYFDGRDREHREDARIRRLLTDSAPAFRDAVVRGFAVEPEDLKRVATPELLDSIATNVLALRLGDRQFAQEIYADFRDQTIRAAERWYDVEVSVRLSSIDERDAASVPRFAVAVQWEYTVTPTHPVQRFACVSDRDEFRELIADVPSTLPWLMTPRPGFDASSREAFELLEYRVDGVERPIRRTARKDGQTYTASLGEETVQAAKPVRVSYLYRVITPQSGHRLFFEVTQPTRGLRIRVDYGDTDIAHIGVTDLVSSSSRTQVSQLPKEVDAKLLSVDLPGWLLPRAGFAFLWTLASELPASDEPAAADPTTSVLDAA